MPVCTSRSWRNRASVSIRLSQSALQLQQDNGKNHQDWLEQVLIPLSAAAADSSVARRRLSHLLLSAPDFRHLPYLIRMHLEVDTGRDDRSFLSGTMSGAPLYVLESRASKVPDVLAKVAANGAMDLMNDLASKSVDQIETLDQLIFTLTFLDESIAVGGFTNLFDSMIFASLHAGLLSNQNVNEWQYALAMKAWNSSELGVRKTHRNIEALHNWPGNNADPFRQTLLNLSKKPEHTHDLKLMLNGSISKKSPEQLLLGMEQAVLTGFGMPAGEGHNSLLAVKLFLVTATGYMHVEDMEFYGDMYLDIAESPVNQTDVKLATEKGEFLLGQAANIGKVSACIRLQHHWLDSDPEKSQAMEAQADALLALEK